MRREIGENVNSFVVMLDGFHVHCQLQQNFMVPAACCMLCVLRVRGMLHVVLFPSRLCACIYLLLGGGT